MAESPEARIGSLCSGIGGLDLGLERAGIGRTAWQCESDPHARTALGRHWPGLPVYPDVKSQDWSEVEPVDIVTAGYPCQPFSTAGRRGGADDPRHLWPAVRDAVGSLGPRLVVLENVRGHLSLGFDVVLGDLADLGFDAEWCLLRASDVGCCHQRARVFIVAFDPARPPDAVADPPDVGLERNGRARNGRTGSEDGGRRAFPWGQYEPAIRRWELTFGQPHPWPTEPDANGKPRLSPAFVEWMQGFPAGWTDGLPKNPALTCLGNAVVPQVAELLGRMILGERGAVGPSPDVLLPTPTSSHPGGSLEDYHVRLRDARPDVEPSFVPLNMLVEQVLS